MQRIDSKISQNFPHVSNYDKLRNTLLRSLDDLNIDSINMSFVQEVNLKKGFERISFYYLIRRLIFFTKHQEATNLHHFNLTGISPNDLKTKLREYFILDEENIDEMAKILLRLVRETSSNYITGKKHKKEMNEFAFDHDYRCYICGSTVDYLDPNNEDTYRTIEHLLPRSMGGNKHEKNLYIACKRCNTVKSDSISWLEKDFSSIHKLYTSHENGLPEFCDHPDLVPLFIEDKFNDFISDEVVYIVSAMNNHKCAICRTDNDISDTTYIIEKEPDDYFHTFNLMCVCNLCLNDIDKNLITQDKFIKRKRITNVSN